MRLSIWSIKAFLLNCCTLHAFSCWCYCTIRHPVSCKNQLSPFYHRYRGLTAHSVVSAPWLEVVRLEAGPSLPPSHNWQMTQYYTNLCALIQTISTVEWTHQQQKHNLHLPPLHFPPINTWWIYFNNKLFFPIILKVKIKC